MVYKSKLLTPDEEAELRFEKLQKIHSILEGFSILQAKALLDDAKSLLDFQEVKVLQCQKS